MSENVNAKIEQSETENEYILKIDDVVYRKQRPNPLKAFKLYTKLFTKNDPESMSEILASELLKITVDGFGVIEKEENTKQIFSGNRLKHLPVVMEWATYRGIEDFLGENQYLSLWSTQFADNIKTQ